MISRCNCFFFFFIIFFFFYLFIFFFFQAEDGIRDRDVTGVQRVLFRSHVPIFLFFPLNDLFRDHVGYLQNTSKQQDRFVA